MRRPTTVAFGLLFAGALLALLPFEVRTNGTEVGCGSPLATAFASVQRPAADAGFLRSRAAGDLTASCRPEARRQLAVGAPLLAVGSVLGIPSRRRLLERRRAPVAG